MNIDNLVAIDMHTHVWRSVTMPAGGRRHHPSEIRPESGQRQARAARRSNGLNDNHSSIRSPVLPPHPKSGPYDVHGPGAIVGDAPTCSAPNDDVRRFTLCQHRSLGNLTTSDRLYGTAIEPAPARVGDARPTSAPSSRSAIAAAAVRRRTTAIAQLDHQASWSAEGKVVASVLRFRLGCLMMLRQGYGRRCRADGQLATQP